jgi:hypothetical protein
LFVWIFFSRWFYCCIAVLGWTQGFTHAKQVNHFPNSKWLFLKHYLLGWGCNSVLECVPSIHEKLGSIPHTEKNKQRKILSQTFVITES